MNNEYESRINIVWRALLVFILIIGMLAPAFPAAAKSQPYTCSTQEKNTLERILGQQAWYGDYDGSNPTAARWSGSYAVPGIISGLIQNPLSVDYSLYPVDPPQRISGRDPLGKWGKTLYYKISENSVEWILRYAFALSEEDISAMRNAVDSGRYMAYRYKGYYYTFYGGVGGGFEAKVSSVKRDDYYYRVTYRLSGGDGYWEDMGTRYAVFSKTSYDGGEYWALRYDGRKEPAEDLPFLDVFAGDYYAGDVSWAYEREITSGTSDLRFSPELYCTRAQAVTFLWRAAGSPKSSAGVSFRDVSADAYYADAVSWAVSKGITNGTGNNRFSPDARCTRAQIVTFMYRKAGSPAVSGSGSGFRDVPSGAYYADAVKWAVGKGITNGTGANAFSPDAYCTRGQIAAFLHRAAD